MLGAAKRAWKEAYAVGAEHGFRNSQATVLAPTGCLVGGTLVPTEHGLVRLESLGDPAGERWQGLGVQVATDEGPRDATRFYVNGSESVVTVSTTRGYRLRGTPRHRVKVVTDTGEWVWRRFDELQPGDRVPLALGQLIDEPRRVALPPLPDGDVVPPRQLTSQLAWLVGCVLGGGSVRDGSVRVHVPADDFDRVEDVRLAAKELFDVEPQVSQRADRVDVVLASDRLAAWWDACGFAGKRSPKGARVTQVPDAVLHSNDRKVYSAFLRGLFHAGSSGHAAGMPWSTTSEEFCDEVQTLLLALGTPSTRRVHHDATGATVAVLDVDRHVPAQDDEVDLVGADATGHGGADVEPVPPARWLLDTVVSAELGHDELTYDLSVPDNVTYVANGFVSHNTIGLVMDCDTTGIEPDLGLVKTKKLVGGGSMSIVNRTVPQALHQLGYNDEQIEAIVAHIDEHNTIDGAPALRDEHMPVFQCAMGDNAIHYMGHVKMMAAAQPFISGAISKTVNMPESATVEDVEQLFYDAWQLGIKAIAIYRDNCKVAQPLSVTKTDEAGSPVASPAIDTRDRMVRRKLPKQRPSQTISFRVADAEGYLTAGEYPGDGIGEIFVKLGKQGSTLSGVMDAFAISVSLGLQYGVPLDVYVQKFMNMRFEPAGMTDDEEIRFATSIIDYLARKLAIEYLPADRRADLGIYTTDERTTALDAQYGGGSTDASAATPVAPTTRAEALPAVPAADSPATYDADAPLCYSCGTPMVRAGSCHLCEQCGATSGCS
ncbi:MAG: hypothetical protein KY462_14165 [Actinobacteria bacterium]|nr:hypothetical protein [Actinomycetota bacterium]